MPKAPKAPKVVVEEPPVDDDLDNDEDTGEDEDDDFDDFDEDDEDLDDLDLDEIVEMMAAIDERVMGLDRGFASFMRAIVVILGDIEIVLSPQSSPEGKAAAQQRVSATVRSLQKAIAAQQAHQQAQQNSK